MPLKKVHPHRKLEPKCVRFLLPSVGPSEVIDNLVSRWGDIQDHVRISLRFVTLGNPALDPAACDAEKVHPWHDVALGCGFVVTCTLCNTMTGDSARSYHKTTAWNNLPSQRNQALQWRAVTLGTPGPYYTATGIVIGVQSTGQMPIVRHMVVYSSELAFVKP